MLFNKDFYPTPYYVIEQMLEGINLTDKVVLEPSAGKGDIIDYLKLNEAKDVLACEINDDLRAIISNKAKVIANDFLTVKSEDISHIDLIIMNPPFSADEKHINHAFEIAPDGCKIISLCNHNTVKLYQEYRERRKLKTTIDTYGSYQNLGDAFSIGAERGTGIDIGLISLQKPGAKQESEFEGFFLEDDPSEQQYNGIMPYNFVMDLVNRYIGAVKIYDEQLESAVRMNQLTSGFYSSSLAVSLTEDQKPKSRNDFKKDLQKKAWLYIFDKMKMEKYVTKGVKEDINKFVEQQTQIPFTMRNIYRMLDIVVGTHGQRMDKALLEVFDKLTEHYDENRYNVEGWKTNSHYLVNQKFILPYMCGSSTGKKVYKSWSQTSERNFELMEDFTKALCYLTGKNYNNMQTLHHRMDYPILIKDKMSGKYIMNYTSGNYFACFQDLERWNKEKVYYTSTPFRDGIPEEQIEVIEQTPALYGEWFDWGFFEVRIYKKGTAHFRFKDVNVWGLFNQHIARIKGYPLFESVKKAA